MDKQHQTVEWEFDKENRAVYRNQSVRVYLAFSDLAIGYWRDKIVFSWSQDCNIWYVQ